jgi:hypothetical protein
MMWREPLTGQVRTANGATGLWLEGQKHHPGDMAEPVMLTAIC